jgi:hypothetical protein
MFTPTVLAASGRLTPALLSRKNSALPGVRTGAWFPAARFTDPAGTGGRVESELFRGRRRFAQAVKNREKRILLILPVPPGPG